MKTIYGYRNCAYHCGPSPDGYVRWSLTRKARDAALASLRERAITDGLSCFAANAGIYPVTRKVRADRDAELLAEIAADAVDRG